MPKIAWPKKRFFSRIHPSVPFIVAILALAYIGLNIWIYFNGTSIFNFSLTLKNAAGTVSIIKDRSGSFGSISSPTPTPTPTPIILRPDEGIKGNYTVSQNKKYTGPTFSKVTFDPLDVRKGQKLTITVTLSSQSPVSAVTGTLTGDTTSMPVTLQKISETAATSVWSTAFSVTDTLLYTYTLKVDAVNGTGTSSVTVAPRS